MFSFSSSLSVLLLEWHSVTDTHSLFPFCQFICCTYSMFCLLQLSWSGVWREMKQEAPHRSAGIYIGVMVISSSLEKRLEIQRRQRNGKKRSKDAEFNGMNWIELRLCMCIYLARSRWTEVYQSRMKNGWKKRCLLVHDHLFFSIVCAGDEIPDRRVSRVTRSSN
jgi:hypothetical protein